MKKLYLDLETTGTNPEIHGIHQISGIIEIAGEIKETFDLKFKPFDGCIFDPKALKVSNVIEDDLKERVYSEKATYNYLCSIFKKYVNPFDKFDKFVLLGYNVSFDKSHMYQMWERNNDPYFFSLFYGSSISIESFAIEALQDRIKYLEDTKLMSIAKALGIEIDESKLHDSMYDIEITRLSHLESIKLITKNYYSGGLVQTPSSNEVTKIVNKGVELSKEEQDENARIMNELLKPTNITPKKVQQLKSLDKISDRSTIIHLKKHKGKTVEQILHRDAGYIIWLHDNCIQGMRFSQDIMDDAVKLQEKQRKTWHEKNQASVKVTNAGMYGQTDNDFEFGLPDDDLPF